jgi:hypothetical protein
LTDAPSPILAAEKREHQWGDLIRQRGKFSGYGSARDAKTAIEEAIKHLGINDAEQQRRLIAQRSD